MKLGVIADSHDHIDNLKKAINVLNKQNVDLVCFCGDLCSVSTIKYFQELKAPVKAVLGNMDESLINILKEIKENGLQFEYPAGEGLIWKLNLRGNKIAIFHGKPEELAQDLADSGLYSFVFTGHTHESFIKRIGQTLWVNPGPLCGYLGLDHKPVRPSLALVDLENEKAEIINL